MSRIKVTLKSAIRTPSISLLMSKDIRSSKNLNIGDYLHKNLWVTHQKIDVPYNNLKFKDDPSHARPQGLYCFKLDDLVNIQSSTNVVNNPLFSLPYLYIIQDTHKQEKFSYAFLSKSDIQRIEEGFISQVDEDNPKADNAISIIHKEISKAYKRTSSLFAGNWNVMTACAGAVTQTLSGTGRKGFNGIMSKALLYAGYDMIDDSDNMIFGGYSFCPNCVFLTTDSYKCLDKFTV